MKRSQVNEALTWAKQLLEENKFNLPCFGYWTLTQWQQNKDRIGIIQSVMLGWDITDYGMNDFRKLGGVLFTIRNGSLTQEGVATDGVGTDAVGTPYAEKLILLYDGQRLPLHYHASKTEDIINRGGGILALKLYNKLDNGEVDYTSDVVVFTDGLKQVVKAGEVVEVAPGNSITLTPNMYHIFWAKEGAGDLVVGEVSSINDDHTDNYFAENVARFSTIEEDEPILHPLCNEYAKVL